MRIGLISDTHGRLRSQVFEVFDGVDRILHAGDIGPPDLLTELEAIAPVTAVRGNTDGFDVSHVAPPEVELELGGKAVVVVHGDALGSPTPSGLRQAYPDADLVVYGHTHRPLVDRSAVPLVVNPGAAGAARFGLAPSVGILTLADSDAAIDVRIVELDQ
jgi:putative phosphoesterase